MSKCVVQLVAEQKCFVSLPQRIIATYLTNEDMKMVAIELSWDDILTTKRRVAQFGWDGSASTKSGDIIEVSTEMAICQELHDQAEVTALTTPCRLGL